MNDAFFFLAAFAAAHIDLLLYSSPATFLAAFAAAHESRYSREYENYFLAAFAAAHMRISC